MELLITQGGANTELDKALRAAAERGICETILFIGISNKKIQCSSGYDKIVDLLIKGGANVNRENVDDETALTLTTSKGKMG